MKKMNIHLSPPRMRAFFNSIDVDGTGEIEYAEFAAGILGQQVGENVSVGNLGEDHAKKQARWKEEAAAKQAQTSTNETDDPIEVIRDTLMASSDGGQGSMLKAFSTFRRKADSLDNKIDFKEFAHALRKMNIRLPTKKMRACFNSLDADGTGEIDFAEFTAGILGQQVGENLSVEMRPH
jgi:Ca2+-binding EF-hand superfamily protein